MAIDVERLREILKVELPRLLLEHPEIRHEMWGLMLEAFPSRQEFNALLEELRAFHRDTDQRFDAVDQRLESMDRRFDAVDQRLESMDRRFDAVDQRFESVDRRFDAVDQRFESVDRRFDAVDQRFDVVESRLDNLTTEVYRLHEETNQRIDQLHQDLQKAIDRLGSRWGIRNESVFRQTIKTLLKESFGVEVESRTIDGEQFDVIISDGKHILVEIAASVGPSIQERLERKRHIYTQATGVAPARIILATASIHSHRAQLLREAGFEVIEPEEETLEEIP